ncbi:MAG: flagellar hook-basal body complex protein FliE [Deltaproteobacteria bacterium]|jgi:flagellar hook-basal body complex protein FliE|nr:flagellar hook-basal body complex protein FliE [Deltaproteobacteria bacterium]
MRVIPLSPGRSLDPGIVLRPPQKESSESFTGALSSKLQEINALQSQSDKAMAEGSIQGANSIHETMIQVEEADISLRLLTRVRNKALEAYQEVMRMQF